MDLIHAGSNLVDLRSIENFEQWDVVSSLYDKIEDNDFQLTVPESEWSLNPIEIGHYLYEDGTEFGGRVTGIKHIGTSIQITGRTWRGLLIDKVVKPPGGSAYKVLTSVEANAAISDLVGTSMGSLFTVSGSASGITVSGSFRYQTLLYCINRMLNDSNARLNLVFSNGVVTLSAVAISDLSNDSEFSQDYSAKLETSVDDKLAYNHIIALGSGELTARQVVELYRQIDGTVNTSPLPSDINDRQIVLDYPNAESLAALTASATDKLNIDYLSVNEVKIDLTESAGLSLGDIVGGRDYVTGLSIASQITQIIRTINSQGTTVQYKVGE